MYRETKWVIICCVLCAEQILSVQLPPVQPPTQLDIRSLSPRLNSLSNSPLYNYDKAILPVIAQPRTRHRAVLKPPTAVTTWYIAKP